MRFRSQRLLATHSTADFRCGQEELDHWLRDHALRAQMAGVARTQVWTPLGSEDVVAFYAVAPTQVTRDGLSRSQAGGFGVVPGYLLARLALHESLQGSGLGAQLLVDAVELIVSAACTAAGRLIVVDALDDAAHEFYRHHDFTPTGGRRLVMKVATAERALPG